MGKNTSKACTRKLRVIKREIKHKLLIRYLYHYQCWKTQKNNPQRIKEIDYTQKNDILSFKRVNDINASLIHRGKDFLLKL